MLLGRSAQADVPNLMRDTSFFTAGSKQMRSSRAFLCKLDVRLFKRAPQLWKRAFGVVAPCITKTV